MEPDNPRPMVTTESYQKKDFKLIIYGVRCHFLKED